MRAGALILTIVAVTLLASIPGVVAICGGSYTNYYDITAADSNTPGYFYVNDSYGVKINGHIQYPVCNDSANYMCVDTSNESAYDCYLDDVKVWMNVIQGNGTDHGSIPSDMTLWLTMNDSTEENGLTTTENNFDGDEIVAGHIGNAMTLTAGSDYLTVANHPSYTDFSICYWWKPTDLTLDNKMFSKYNSYAWGGGIDFMYRCPDNNGGDCSIYFGDSGAGNSHSQIIEIGNFSNDVWVHKCHVGDASNFIKSYVNGELVASKTISSNFDSGTEAFYLGMENANTEGTDTFDEFMIFDIALTAANVRAMFNNTHPDGYAPTGTLNSFGSYPDYSSPSQPTTPRKFPVSSISHNVTWTDSGDSIDTGWIEHNFTGTMATYVMTNVTTLWSYTTGNMSAGTFSYKYHANNTAGIANATGFYTFVLNKADAEINMSLNGTPANLSLTFLETANLTAWTNVSGVSPTIHRNSSAISNPTIYNPVYGYYNITAYLNHENYTASSVTYWMSVAKASSGLTLSASPSWSAAEETTVTITCTNTRSLTMSLTRDGVGVSNPYSATHDFDNYDFVCTVSDTFNYTPSTASNTLSITSGGFGCTNTDTYAFETNLTVPAGNTTVVLDMTTILGNYFIRGDFGDVYPVLNTSPAGWYNTTYDDLFIINTSGYEGLDISIRFGNAIVNYNYNTTSNATDETSFTYSVINEYMKLTFVDERTGGIQRPPSSNHTLYIFCSGGISSHNITADYMTVATFEQADEIKIQVQYSVTEIYYRNYVIDTDVTTRNVYLVDADLDQVVQLIISLQDATGDFDNSLLVAKKYVEGTQRTITEHYYDAEGKVIIYLINGDKYTLFVDNGVEERSIGYLYVDSVDLTKTLTIGQVLTTNQTLGNVTFGLYNVTDTIYFNYIDESGMTQSAEMWIYNATNSSEQLYYVNSTNRSRISFSYTVTDDNQTHIVKIKVHHYTFGLNSLDLVMPFFYPSFVFVNPFELLDDAGLVGDLPGGLEYTQLIGVLAIIGVAMIFTATTGPVGGIVATLTAAIMMGFGWWEIDIVILVIAVILAFINKLTENRRDT